MPLDLPFDFVDQFSPESLTATSVPRRHEAEADVFARHAEVPGHDQDLFRRSSFTVVGGGGIGSTVGYGLARAGAGAVTFVEHDVVERTNLSRQFYFADDIGQPKAVRLIHNLLPHAVGGSTLNAIPAPFQQAVEHYAVPTDVLIVGVDNNACRLACVRWARARHIPAVFTMLSEDGANRCVCFLQGPNSTDPCLWCALPNLDPQRSAPCSAALVNGCLLSAAMTLFFAHRAVLGWPAGIEPFNWRDIDLTGAAPDVRGTIERRPDCIGCAGDRA